MAKIIKTIPDIGRDTLQTNSAISQFPFVKEEGLSVLPQLDSHQ